HAAMGGHEPVAAQRRIDERQALDGCLGAHRDAEGPGCGLGRGCGRVSHADRERRGDGGGGGPGDRTGGGKGEARGQGAGRQRPRVGRFATGGSERGRVGTVHRAGGQGGGGDRQGDGHRGRVDGERQCLSGGQGRGRRGIGGPN